MSLCLLPIGLTAAAAAVSTAHAPQPAASSFVIAERIDGDPVSLWTLTDGLVDDRPAPIERDNRRIGSVRDHRTSAAQRQEDRAFEEAIDQSRRRPAD